MDKRGVCVYLRRHIIQQLDHEREILGMTRSLLVEKIIEKYLEMQRKEKK